MMALSASTIAVATLLAALTPASAMELRGRGQVNPELEPESHEQFFNKDNPHDVRAVADKHYKFSYPFPSIQHSEQFDADYVKDENSDGGEWEAQMTYDTLRAKIVKKQQEVDELAKKKEEEQKEFEEAKANEEAAEKARKEAEEKADDAKQEFDEANDKLQGYIAKNGSLPEQQALVGKEMSDLDKCKEELAKAREQLKKLMEEKEQRDKAIAEQEAAANATIASSAAAAPNASTDAAAAEEEAEEEEGESDENATDAAEDSDLKKAEKKLAKAEKKLAKEQAQYNVTKEQVDAQAAKVEQLEADLKKAEQHLEDLRHPPLPGDAKKEHKSGAVMPSAIGALLLLAFTAA